MTEPEDPAQIREQIEATREELGDTVEALAAKTDVKAQAKRKFSETKASIAAKQAEVLGKTKEGAPEVVISAASGLARMAEQNPVQVVTVGAFGFGLLAGWLTRD
jgi:ElaB/YqjD/DUF883 family membrane-anchored ribosome-binding protein